MYAIIESVVLKGFVFLQACALFVIVLFSLMAGGCGSYHAGIGLGNDLGLYFNGLQNQLDHGKHADHYLSYEDRMHKSLFGRFKSAFKD
jgi:hypothetical protein